MTEFSLPSINYPTMTRWTKRMPTRTTRRYALVCMWSYSREKRRLSMGVYPANKLLRRSVLTISSRERIICSQIRIPFSHQSRKVSSTLDGILKLYVFFSCQSGHGSFREFYSMIEQTGFALIIPLKISRWNTENKKERSMKREIGKMGRDKVVILKFHI